jgi:sec-independent protein translocase protein TatB
VSIGAQELLVIAVVALLVVGPDRLPEVARNAAKFISRLRAETSRSVDELKRAAELEGLDREWREVGAELRGTRDELRGARDELRRPFAPERGQPSASGTGATAAFRPDDRPPPIDVEAT